MLGQRTAFPDETLLSPPAVEVEGVMINLPTLAAATAEALRRADLGQGFMLMTLNLDDLVKIRSIARFAQVYRRAELVTADGWPVVWLAGRKGVPLERTCGADIVEPVCEGAAERGLGVYFIGPGPSAQAGAIERLRRRFPALRVAGAEAPQLPAGNDPSILNALDLDALAARINASNARLCFISLGHPKQGFLADALTARCPRVGFICVGAALDFIAGTCRRAPLWMRNSKLEWLWRLASEPRRLGARYALCGLVFLQLAQQALFPRRTLQPATAQGASRPTATSPAEIVRLTPEPERGARDWPSGTNSLDQRA